MSANFLCIYWRSCLIVFQTTRHRKICIYKKHRRKTYSFFKQYFLIAAIIKTDF